MPKQKSHKGIAKKVTVRPGGSTKIGKPGANHMSGKNQQVSIENLEKDLL